MFTTTVHAMKSALANIGENEASELAFTLEKAGFDGDLEFIAANTEQFIETLETLIKRINPAETATDTGSEADIIEDTVYLIEQLQIVINTCEDYDRKAVFSVLDSLKEKQWKFSTSAALEEIHEKLSLHSDFDGAIELVRAFLKTHRGKEEE
jgi:HPt (histidine-containing phosphotransfer) domain-containing protein